MLTSRFYPRSFMRALYLGIDLKHGAAGDGHLRQSAAAPVLETESTNHDGYMRSRPLGEAALMHNSGSGACRSRKRAAMDLTQVPTRRTRCLNAFLSYAPSQWQDTLPLISLSGSACSMKLRTLKARICRENAFTYLP